MNPLPVVLSLFARHRLTVGVFVALICFSVALGVAVTTQERALRQGTARAADKFDLVIGAPGSPFDLVLASVYARPAAMGLVPTSTLNALSAREDVGLAAPIAFGDSVMGFPLMGTTQQFVDHLAGGLTEGRSFTGIDEAVLGAGVPLKVGQVVRAAHGGLDSASTEHTDEIEIVGRLARTNSAWDYVVIVPVEQVWETHEHHEVADEAEHAHAPHEQDHLGAPFDVDSPGVPAIVVAPATLAAAYQLRSEFRTAETQAVFPAEILVQLYAILGDARAILSYVALATQLLVLGAILCGLLIVLQLYRRGFAVLRALGATSGYVFLVAWSYVALLIAAGAALGLVVGMAASWAISGYMQNQTGIVIPVTLSREEVRLVLMLLAAGSVLAAIPALAIYRQPVVEGLR